MTPNELRGRMEAIRTTFTASAPPIGSIMGGSVATAIGASAAVVIGGVVTITAVVVADRIVPAIRRTGSGSEEEPSAEPAQARA
jgi:hypothetical protein